MAMTADGMKSKIEAEIISAGKGPITAGGSNVLLEICKGIIAEITANAQASGTGTGGPGAHPVAILPGGIS